jgi:hypothetical protein
VRRGLLKDLANTPTQIVCGYRLYGPDLPRLVDLAGDVVSVDLLNGDCSVGATRLVPPLAIANDLAAWFRERVERDAVPPGMVHAATTTLSPRKQASGLAIDCRTVIESRDGTFESHDTAGWHTGDISDW